MQNKVVVRNQIFDDLLVTAWPPHGHALDTFLVSQAKMSDGLVARQKPGQRAELADLFAAGRFNLDARP